MFKQSMVVLALTLATQANATDVVTQWNFNSVPADGNTGTGTSVPNMDMVIISGNAIAPISEPESYAMLLAGLGIIGFSARRKQ